VDDLGVMHLIASRLPAGRPADHDDGASWWFKDVQVNNLLAAAGQPVQAVIAYSFPAPWNYLLSPEPDRLAAFPAAFP
jgi:hypothetical protein